MSRGADSGADSGADGEADAEGRGYVPEDDHAVAADDIDWRPRERFAGTCTRCDRAMSVTVPRPQVLNEQRLPVRCAECGHINQLPKDRSPPA